MKKYPAIWMVFVALLFVQCQKDGMADLDAIKGHWVHAYEEEDPEDYLVYRPHDFQEFPPSRYRHAFQFEDNGICKFFVLAPDDGHYFQQGRWQYNATTNIIRVSDDLHVIYQFRIIELTEELLKIEML